MQTTSQAVTSIPGLDIDVSEYGVPDMQAPLDVAAYMAHCPEHAVARGMFFGDIVDALKRRGLRPSTSKRYVAFSNYPQREFIEFAARSVELLHPDLPLREGLRRVGHLAYPTFRDTMIGRVMFGVLGDDIEAVMKIVPKGYDAALNVVQAKTLAVGRGYALFRFENLHTLFDSYQVGVMEGAILACGREGEVRLKCESLSTGQALVTWR